MIHELLMFIAPRKYTAYLLWRTRRQIQLIRENINRCIICAIDCQKLAWKEPETKVFPVLADKLMTLAVQQVHQIEELECYERTLNLVLQVYA